MTLYWLLVIALALLAGVAILATFVTEQRDEIRRLRAELEVARADLRLYRQDLSEARARISLDACPNAQDRRAASDLN